MFIYNKKEEKYKIIDADPDSTMETRMDAGVYNLTVVKTFFGKEFHLNRITDTYERGKVVNAGVFKTVRDKVNKFFNPNMAFARDAMGLKTKIGMIFNGKPGTGKTFLAGQIATELATKLDAVGIVVTQDVDLSSFVDMVRKHDPDRHIIIILDEFEKVYDMSYIDSNLLGFLDGSKSKDNVITIATVNSTGRMPDVLTSRPGRFEEIYEFSINDDEVLKGMVESILPDEFKDVIKVETVIAKMKKHSVYAMDRLALMIRDMIFEHKEKEGKEEKKNA